jgi:hypothetical protein
VLPFRVRVKVRGEATTLLESRMPAAGGLPVRGTQAGAQARRKPDPLLVLGHHGLARTAALTLSLDGVAGTKLFTAGGDWRGGRALLAALLSWLDEPEGAGAEGRAWRVEAESGPGGTLRVRVEAREARGYAPRSGLDLSARLTAVEGEFATLAGGGSVPSDRNRAAQTVRLLPQAPGRYAAELSADAAGVYRLEVLDGGRLAAERFVSVPYPPEYQGFGEDRNALQELAEAAGGGSKLLNLPDQDLRAWLAAQKARREYLEARDVLLILAALCFLAEIAARGLRAR